MHANRLISRFAKIAHERPPPKNPWALGFGLTFPIPKRALRAHGLPPWGSSAPAHLTHPTAMQPAGGAHASSSSVDVLVPSVAELAVRLCCALVVMWGSRRAQANVHHKAVGCRHVKRSCRGSVWTTAASHSSTWSRMANVAMSLATNWSTVCTLGVEVRTIRGSGTDRIR